MKEKMKILPKNVVYKDILLFQNQVFYLIRHHFNKHDLL